MPLAWANRSTLCAQVPPHPLPLSSQDDENVCGTQFSRGWKALKGLLIFRDLGLCSAVIRSILCYSLFHFLKASQEQVLTWGWGLPWLITEKAGSGSVQVRTNFVSSETAILIWLFTFPEQQMQPSPCSYGWRSCKSISLSGTEPCFHHSVFLSRWDSPSLGASSACSSTVPTRFIVLLLLLSFF